MSVLLPAPFSPISACTSPFSRRRFTPANATVGPKLLLMCVSERAVIDFGFSCARLHHSETHSNQATHLSSRCCIRDRAAAGSVRLSSAPDRQSAHADDRRTL